MEIKNAEALDLANNIYNATRFKLRLDKAEAARNLAASRLFGAWEIAKILGVGVRFVEEALGVKTNKPINPRVWKLRHLYALSIVARNWEQTGTLMSYLVIAAVQDGTSLRSVHTLTGVPMEDLREVFYDKDNLGILR